MRSRTAWGDYFPSTSTTFLNSKTYTSRQTPSNTGVYISNCLFTSIMSSDNGGALYCSSVTYFLVESTSFFSCKINGYSGGAIYFSNSNSQSVLHSVCGYDCSSGSQPFAYIQVNNAASSKNYANYSSIVNTNTDSSYLFTLNNGKICCPSINISLNKIRHVAGITCGPFNDPYSFTCSLTYSSFVDNNARNDVLFWLRTDAKYEIKSCNILRNKQGELSWRGTLVILGNLMIKNSCILENNAIYIFYYGTITLSNCTIDKATGSGGSLTITNTIIKSFILGLNHMSTRNCHSEYDSAGTLTPDILPPAPTKQIHLCTCGISFYQIQLSYLVSLIFVFSLIFIYIDGSSNPLY
jgi:hypothetical protein